MTTASLLISLVVLTAGGSIEEPILQYRYAEQLFESGDYQAARREYKRFLFYQPDTEFKDLADYRIAQSYYYQNQPERAEHLFREFLDVHLDSPFRSQSRLMIARLHFDAAAYSLARTTLFELLHSSKDTDVVATSRYLRGWCYIYTGDWNKAITELRQVDALQTDVPHRKNARLLANTLFQKTPLPYKSPQMAGWFSTIIPGSGQFYVGKVKEGLLAAALSGTFIYLAADAARERRYVDCAGISLVGWYFYWGNRTNAQRLASEYNAQREQAFIETLKRQAEHVAPQ